MMLAMVTLPSAIFVMRAETFPNAVIGAPLSCGAQRAAARDGSHSEMTPLAGGKNPIDAAPSRRGRPRCRRRRSARSPTAIVASLSPGFRNAKHRQQWTNTLATYAAPLRDKALDAIHTEDVLEVLTPIWQTKAETASRVRGRIERVLDAAKAKGLRSGENPARWRGHLDSLCRKRQKLQRGHHAAMPFADVPAFVADLRQRDAVAALALEFTILTASRSGEVLGARWNEIDREAAVWTVPAERMKSGREHRVPLTARALEILDTVDRIRSGEFVFPGRRRSRPLSGMSMEMLLAPHEGDERHGSRLPQLVPGLGRRAHHVPARGRRGVPLSRVDRMGLVWLLKGERVVLLTEAEARLERGLAVYRRPGAPGRRRALRERDAASGEAAAGPAGPGPGTRLPAAPERQP